MATQGLAFYLWVVGVVLRVSLVDIVDVIDIVDVYIDVIDLVVCVNVCLRKPRDGELIVEDHGADEEVLEEYSATTFDADIATGVADVCAAPVERAVVVLHPNRRVVAGRVDIVRAEIAVSIWIPKPSVGSNNGFDRCSRIVPSHVVDVVVVVEIVKNGHLLSRDNPTILNKKGFNFYRNV